jgi:hypothetical protein
MTERSINSLVRYLWRPADLEEAQIYTILDAARDKRIYPMLLDSDADFFCLYRGQPAHDLADVAPYIVRLESGSSFTQELLSDAWGNSWGIFMDSAATLSELKTHFRQFLTVHDETGKPLLFRYYDPRVLRIYLPTCTAPELRIIFGPVTRYYSEAEDKHKLIEFICTGKDELIQNVINL